MRNESLLIIEYFTPMQTCCPMDTNEFEFYSDEVCFYDESNTVGGNCEDDVVCVHDSCGHEVEDNDDTDDNEVGDHECDGNENDERDEQEWDKEQDDEIDQEHENDEQDKEESDNEYDESNSYRPGIATSSAAVCLVST